MASHPFFPIVFATDVHEPTMDEEYQMIMDYERAFDGRPDGEKP